MADAFTAIGPRNTRLSFGSANAAKISSKRKPVNRMRSGAGADIAPLPQKLIAGGLKPDFKAAVLTVSPVR